MRGPLSEPERRWNSASNCKPQRPCEASISVYLSCVRGTDSLILNRVRGGSKPRKDLSEPLGQKGCTARRLEVVVAICGGRAHGPECLHSNRINLVEGSKRFFRTPTPSCGLSDGIETPLLV